ncbi:unnamed protein product, partial [Dicrocoelium dendriticum]
MLKRKFSRTSAGSSECTPMYLLHKTKKSASGMQRRKASTCMFGGIRFRICLSLWQATGRLRLQRDHGWLALHHPQLHPHTPYP